MHYWDRYSTTAQNCGRHFILILTKKVFVDIAYTGIYDGRYLQHMHTYIIPYNVSDLNLRILCTHHARMRAPSRMMVVP